MSKKDSRNIKVLSRSSSNSSRQHYENLNGNASKTSFLPYDTQLMSTTLNGDWWEHLPDRSKADLLHSAPRDVIFNDTRPISSPFDNWWEYIEHRNIPIPLSSSQKKSIPVSPTESNKSTTSQVHSIKGRIQQQRFEGIETDRTEESTSNSTLFRNKRGESPLERSRLHSRVAKEKQLSQGTSTSRESASDEAHLETSMNTFSDERKSQKHIRHMKTMMKRKAMYGRKFILDTSVQSSISNENIVSSEDREDNTSVSNTNNEHIVKHSLSNSAEHGNMSLPRSTHLFNASSQVQKLSNNGYEEIFEEQENEKHSMTNMPVNKDSSNYVVVPEHSNSLMSVSGNAEIEDEKTYTPVVPRKKADLKTILRERFSLCKKSDQVISNLQHREDFVSPQSDVSNNEEQRSVTSMIAKSAVKTQKSALLVNSDQEQLSSESYGTSVNRELNIPLSRTDQKLKYRHMQSLLHMDDDVHLSVTDSFHNKSLVRVLQQNKRKVLQEMESSTNRDDSTLKNSIPLSKADKKLKHNRPQTLSTDDDDIKSVSFPSVTVSFRTESPVKLLHRGEFIKGLQGSDSSSTRMGSMSKRDLVIPGHSGRFLSSLDEVSVINEINTESPVSTEALHNSLSMQRRLSPKDTSHSVRSGHVISNLQCVGDLVSPKDNDTSITNTSPMSRSKLKSFKNVLKNSKQTWVSGENSVMCDNQHVSIPSIPMSKADKKLEQKKQFSQESLDDGDDDLISHSKTDAFYGDPQVQLSSENQFQDLLRGHSNDNTSTAVTTFQDKSKHSIVLPKHSSRKLSYSVNDVLNSHSPVIAQSSRKNKSKGLKFMQEVNHHDKSGKERWSGQHQRDLASFHDLESNVKETSIINATPRSKGALLNNSKQEQLQSESNLRFDNSVSLSKMHKKYTHKHMQSLPSKIDDEDDEEKDDEDNKKDGGDGVKDDDDEIDALRDDGVTHLSSVTESFHNKTLVNVSQKNKNSALQNGDNISPSRIKSKSKHNLVIHKYSRRDLSSREEFAEKEMGNTPSPVVTRPRQKFSTTQQRLLPQVLSISNELDQISSKESEAKLASSQDNLLGLNINTTPLYSMSPLAKSSLNSSRKLSLITRNTLSRENDVSSQDERSHSSISRTSRQHEKKHLSQNGTEKVMNFLGVSGTFYNSQHLKKTHGNEDQEKDVLAENERGTQLTKIAQELRKRVHEMEYKRQNTVASDKSGRISSNVQYGEDIVSPRDRISIGNMSETSARGRGYTPNNKLIYDRRMLDNIMQNKSVESDVNNEDEYELPSGRLEYSDSDINSAGTIIVSPRLESSGKLSQTVPATEDKHDPSKTVSTESKSESNIASEYSKEESAVLQNVVVENVGKKNSSKVTLELQRSVSDVAAHDRTDQISKDQSLSKEKNGKLISNNNIYMLSEKRKKSKDVEEWLTQSSRNSTSTPQVSTRKVYDIFNRQPRKGDDPSVMDVQSPVACRLHSSHGFDKQNLAESKKKRKNNALKLHLESKVQVPKQQIMRIPVNHKEDEKIFEACKLLATNIPGFDSRYCSSVSEEEDELPFLSRTQNKIIDKQTRKKAVEVEYLKSVKDRLKLLNVSASHPPIADKNKTKTTADKSKTKTRVPKPVNPDRLFEGKVYKPPPRMRTPYWVNERFCKAVTKSVMVMTDKTDQYSVKLEVEKIITKLISLVQKVIRYKRKGINPFIDEVIKHLYHSGLIKTAMSYIAFCMEYLPEHYIQIALRDTFTQNDSGILGSKVNVDLNL